MHIESIFHYVLECFKLYQYVSRQSDEEEKEIFFQRISHSNIVGEWCMACLSFDNLTFPQSSFKKW